MKLRHLLFIALLAFANAKGAGAQVVDVVSDIPKEVIVESRGDGDETIKPEEIHLLLSTKNRSYSQTFIGTTGKKYQLTVAYSPFKKSISIEHWEVRLHKLDKKGRLNGRNLFTEEWYDYEPKQNYVGFLYPKEEIPVLDRDNRPLWGEGHGFYHYSTIRKINVEGFCVTIRVGDQKFNAKHRDKLDLFEVFISLGPHCVKSY